MTKEEIITNNVDGVIARIRELRDYNCDLQDQLRLERLENANLRERICFLDEQYSVFDTEEYEGHLISFKNLQELEVKKAFVDWLKKENPIVILDHLNAFLHDYTKH